MANKLLGSVGLSPGSDSGFDLDTKGQIHGYTSTQYALDVGDNNFVIYADSSTASGLAYGASAKSILSASGDILYASGANTLARLAKGDNDEVLTLKSGIPSWESAGGSGNTYARVVKKVDQTVNSTVTPEDDDELLVALNANKTYGWQLWLFVKSISAGGYRTDFTLPSGASGEMSNQAFNSVTIADAIDMTTVRTHATDDTVQFLPFVGRAITNSTAGNLQFQFAQDSSNGGNTTTLAGSYLVVWEETA